MGVSGEWFARTGLEGSKPIPRPIWSGESKPIPQNKIFGHHWGGRPPPEKGKGKGTRTECSSYRPVTLLSVPGKVFAMSSSPDSTPCFRTTDDLTNLDSPVVAPHWMQSWHCARWRKSTENSNSRCMPHSYSSMQCLTP